MIGKDYIFVNSMTESTNQMFYENALIGFRDTLENTISEHRAPQSCMDEILTLMCFNIFPACDYGYNVSTPRQVSMSISNCVCVQAHTFMYM